MRKPFVPIYFTQQQPLSDGQALLAADIGGTKVDMALYKMQNGEPVLVKEFRYASKQWDSMSDIIKDFCKDIDIPGRICISFAGPILEGKAFGVNLHWGIDSQAICQETDINTVFLINDLEANCYGLAALKESDLKVIYPGIKKGDGNAAVISPGTGLGEGGLFWDGQAYRPFATEGGHTHFAPRNEFDWKLFQFLLKKYGHVSWERVISGPGICEIFNYLHYEEKWPVTENIASAMTTPDFAAAISEAALEGSPICEETLRLFSRYLAQEAANLAMKLKTTGGLYIGGGIIPKIWNEVHNRIFYEYFFAVGRMNPLVESVPVTLILNPKTALLGAAWYGAFS